MALPEIDGVDKVLFTTWPWQVGEIQWVIDHAKMLGVNEVSQKVSQGISVLGNYPDVVKAWGGNMDDFAAAVKDAGLRFSFWCGVTLISAIKEARLINELAHKYNPKRIYLDAEKAAKNHIGELWKFLQELENFEESLDIQVGLMSYRVANYHPMDWIQWYKSGKIHFLAHQFYPINVVGGNTVAGWVQDHVRSITSHQIYLNSAGVPDMPYLPVLPAFKGTSFEGAPGWIPNEIAYLEGAAHIQNVLLPRDRLLGFGHWSLDRTLFLPELQKVYEVIRNNFVATEENGEEPKPVPIPFESLTADELRAALVLLGNGIEVFDGFNLKIPREHLNDTRKYYPELG